MVLANGCWIEDELWYWDVARRALCSMNLKNGKISIKFTDSLYPGYKVFSYGEKVFVTCQNEGRILIYHRYTETINEVRLPNDQEKSAVYLPLQWEQYLYLVPAELKHQAIICFDMETGGFIEVRDVISQLEQGYDVIASNAQFLFPCVSDGVLWSAISYTKYYISYHLTTGELCVYQSEVSDSLWTVKCEKGTLYMTQTDSVNLIVKKQDEAERIITVKEGECAIKEPYSCIESLREYQVVLARKGRNVVVLNSESLECKTICLYEEAEEESSGSRTIYCVEDETYIYVFPWQIENTYAICKENWDVEQRDFRLDDISQLKYVLPLYFENKEENEIVGENAEVTLRDLCAYLANREET